MWIVAASAIALAAPAPAELAQALERDAAPLSAHSPVPFGFTADELGDLADGDTVTRRTDGPDGPYASGAIWLDAPLEVVWVALQDGDHQHDDTMIKEYLPGATALRKQVHMRMQLPWPLGDRQWVAEFSSNRALYDATDGRVWQRSWHTVDPELAPNPDPDARWVDTNVGAWTLVEVGGGTLATFAVRTELGGSIPPGVARSFALGTIGDNLERLQRRTPTIPAHYDSGHFPVHAPDGRRLPPGLDDGLAEGS